jgi:hypothetical protein
MINVFAIVGIFAISWVITKFVIGDINEVEERKIANELVRDIKKMVS